MHHNRRLLRLQFGLTQQVGGLTAIAVRVSALCFGFAGSDRACDKTAYSLYTV